MSLITETNQQYYAGAQTIIVQASQSQFNFGFNTDMKLVNYDPSAVDYPLNNFKIYTSLTGASGSWIEFTPESDNWIPYTLSDNTITIASDTGATLNAGTYLTVQLKSLSGGRYGNEDAYGNTVEKNYNSYSYIKISDIINNFQLAYIGDGKLIPSAKRTDVIFHAKRALQELSYDTLKAVNSQELSVPISLSVPIPQDYVNLVGLSRIDSQGVKHPIYPTELSNRAYDVPIQDDAGIPIQDNQAENLSGTSQINKRWDNNDLKNRKELYDYWVGLGYQNGDWPQGWGWQGQQYGLDTELANINGYYLMDYKNGKISFSNNLVDSLIILEYISDGLAYDHDMKVPKLAEEAVYAYILHSIIASKINQPEYIVQRLKKEKSAKIRNAKIRLSNIKPTEIINTFRGKSKWIKH